MLAAVLRWRGLLSAQPLLLSCTHTHPVTLAAPSLFPRIGPISQIELQIVYLEEHAVPSTYVMPDVISVEVQFGVDIPPKLIQVPIVRAMPEKKPFLGGFRSRKTAVEYHHASSQTGPPARQAAVVRRRESEETRGHTRWSVDRRGERRRRRKRKAFGRCAT